VRLGSIDALIVTLYFAMVIGIGFYLKPYETTGEDFFLAGRVSIWFLVGLLLTAYGLLISAAGLYQALVPPVHPPVLADLHAGIWWGLLILGIGLFYAGASSLGKRNKLRGRTRRCGNRELAVPEQVAQGFAASDVSSLRISLRVFGRRRGQRPPARGGPPKHRSWRKPRGGIVHARLAGQRVPDRCSINSCSPSRPLALAIENNERWRAKALRCKS
jgi:hypothetical protein